MTESFDLDELHARYADVDPPPCHVCGGRRSIQSMGGGQATIWACSDRPRPFDDFWYQHYRESRWTQLQESDTKVLRLIDAYRALQQSNVALKQTIDAFPDAHNAANLAHARAERDKLRATLTRYELPGTPTYDELTTEFGKLLDRQDEWRREIQEQGKELEAALGVVKAARAWANAPLGTYNMPALAHDLMTAVRAFEALVLDTDTEGPAGSN